jgi:diguanylate cyclase (GGDEF)-like protein
MNIQLNLQSILYRIDHISRYRLIAFIFALEVLIFWADYVTGPLAPFEHLYIVPILIAAFFLNSKWAYFLTLIATVGGIPVFLKLLDEFDLTPVLLDFVSKGTIFFTIAFLGKRIRELLKNLHCLASEDSLTKANSRRHFYETSTAEIARSYRYKHPISIAFIDLDNFKEVNDKQGHDKGDQLLAETASTIRADLREGDLLGRLGGDEFGILLGQTDQEQAKIILTRMRENLLNAIAPFETKVTFSIGVVTYLADKQITIDDLLALADNAMYTIKKSTKNSIQSVIA